MENFLLLNAKKFVENLWRLKMVLGAFLVWIFTHVGNMHRKKLIIVKKTYRVCRLILSYEVGAGVTNNEKLLTIKRDEVLVNSRIILSITDWRVNNWYNCCLNNWVATWLHRAVILNYHFQYQISLQQSKKQQNTTTVRQTLNAPTYFTQLIYIDASREGASVWQEAHRHR